MKEEEKHLQSEVYYLHELFFFFYQDIVGWKERPHYEQIFSHPTLSKADHFQEMNEGGAWVVLL